MSHTVIKPCWLAQWLLYGVRWLSMSWYFITWLDQYRYVGVSPWGALCMCVCVCVCVGGAGRGSMHTFGTILLSIIRPDKFKPASSSHCGHSYSLWASTVCCPSTWSMLIFVWMLCGHQCGYLCSICLRHVVSVYVDKYNTVILWMLPGYHSLLCG